MSEDNTTTSLEVLAHRLWAHWSMHVADEEDISQDRLERWERYWVPYEDLPSEVKEVDEDLVNQYLLERPNYPDNEWL